MNRLLRFVMRMDDRLSGYPILRAYLEVSLGVLLVIILIWLFLTTLDQ